MNEFGYQRPQSVQAAVQALRADPDARLLAGGQSLLAAMKLGLAAPSALLDLRGVTGLRDMRAQDGGLWLGAMCTHAEVARSPLVQTHAPMLARLAGGIADAQVRNRGTLGGSVANNDPAACWPGGLLALGAVLHTDRRTLAADDFFTGMFATALEPDELLCGVWFPPCGQAGYLKWAQPASRFALVGVAVAQWAAPAGVAVRVAVTGLGQGVLRWPEAEAALQRTWSPAALEGLQLSSALAIGDLHASAEYKAHLAGVLARRAVAQLAGPVA